MYIFPTSRPHRDGLTGGHHDRREQNPTPSARCRGPRRQHPSRHTHHGQDAGLRRHHHALLGVDGADPLTRLTQRGDPYTPAWTDSVFGRTGFR